MNTKEAKEVAVNLKESWEKIKSIIEEGLGSCSLELENMEAESPLNRLLVTIKDVDEEEPPVVLGLSFLSFEAFEKDLKAFLELFEGKGVSLHQINSDSDIEIDEPLIPRLLLKDRQLRDFKKELKKQLDKQLSDRQVKTLYLHFLGLDRYTIPEEYPLPYDQISYFFDVSESRFNEIKNEALSKLNQSTREDLERFQEKFEEYLKMVSCECGELYSLGHKGKRCEKCDTVVKFRADTQRESPLWDCRL